ncbi:hypothetical protein GRI38_02130 [Altererythrobacter aurantiacus]|uniref:Uncharacterized protein n=1 Tax=Parapontixanthobacter aurantiacus TaxID=1463599 RepID=A0A844Z8C1_9SPHN|nr:hypothetical protein [Parapontixanthobacter aurantiacus]MXO84831.1 hypothetical protein [Parapontixanthobacter aurantiacus]
MRKLKVKRLLASTLAGLAAFYAILVLIFATYFPALALQYAKSPSDWREAVQFIPGYAYRAVQADFFTPSDGPIYRITGVTSNASELYVIFRDNGEECLIWIEDFNEFTRSCFSEGRRVGFYPARYEIQKYFNSNGKICFFEGQGLFELSRQVSCRDIQSELVPWRNLGQ